MLFCPFNDRGCDSGCPIYLSEDVSSVYGNTTQEISGCAFTITARILTQINLDMNEMEEVKNVK